MTITSQAGQVRNHPQTLLGGLAARARTWIAACRNRFDARMQEDYLRSLDQRTLADIGIEFAPEHGPSLLTAKAEAITLAVNATLGPARAVKRKHQD